jgi:hypothetical protein
LSLSEVSADGKGGHAERPALDFAGVGLWFLNQFCNTVVFHVMEIVEIHVCYSHKVSLNIKQTRELTEALVHVAGFSPHVAQYLGRLCRWKANCLLLHEQWHGPACM